VLWGEGSTIRYVASGAIKLPKTTARIEKLRLIHIGMAGIIRQYSPSHFAVEEVFYNKNPKSTMVLGEARGAAILAAALAELPVFEYSAREVKLSVTGNGAAHKGQVNFMLGKMLGLQDPPKNPDESDALAVAVCHAFKHSVRSVV
jgi:crossover junction endodeoxyribonuclease RuvC